MSSQVPAWALENRARFLGCPQAAGEHKPLIPLASVFHSLYGRDALAKAEATLEEAAGIGALTTAPRFTEPPLPGLTRGPEYFRDVNNHPEVLASILETCRFNARFSPATSGNDGSIAAAQEQHDRFLDFLSELDRYHAYTTLVNLRTDSIQNSRHDCETLLNALVGVIEKSLGSLGVRVAQSIKGGVRAAAEHVTRHDVTYF